MNNICNNNSNGSSLRTPSFDVASSPIGVRTSSTTTITTNTTCETYDTAAIGCVGANGATKSNHQQHSQGQQASSSLSSSSSSHQQHKNQQQQQNTLSAMKSQHVFATTATTATAASATTAMPSTRSTVSQLHTSMHKKLQARNATATGVAMHNGDVVAVAIAVCTSPASPSSSSSSSSSSASSLSSSGCSASFPSVDNVTVQRDNSCTTATTQIGSQMTNRNDNVGSGVTPSFVSAGSGSGSNSGAVIAQKLSRTIPADKINLRLILVSGKTKEFLFNSSDSAGDIAQTVFDNWPEDWEREAVSKAEILRLIYQGRFLHCNVTLGALGLTLGKTTVMHLVPRDNLPEPNSQDQRQKSKGGSSRCCSTSCCIL